jgi:hypothetical protein
MIIVAQGTRAHTDIPRYPAFAGFQAGRAGLADVLSGAIHGDKADRIRAGRSEECFKPPSQCAAASPDALRWPKRTKNKPARPILTLSDSFRKLLSLLVLASSMAFNCL